MIVVFLLSICVIVIIWIVIAKKISKVVTTETPNVRPEDNNVITTPHRKHTRNVINPFSVINFIILIFLTCTLPFHYCPSRECVMLKKSLSFKYTIVEEYDISEQIERYNSANMVDKIIIGSESLYMNLVEEGIIIASKSEDYAE